MIPKKLHIVFSYVIFEFLLLNLCILSVLYFKVPEIMTDLVRSGFLNEFVELLLIFNSTWGVIILLNGDPNFYVNYSFKQRLKYLILNTFLFIGISSTLVILFKLDYFNRTVLLLPVFLFSFLNLFFFSFLFEFYLRRTQKVFDSKVLVVGAAHRWKQIVKLTEKIRPLGYSTVGLVYDQQFSYKGSGGPNVLGQISDLSSVLEHQLVDEIFISSSALKEKEIQKVFEVADYKGVRVKLIPEAPSINGTILNTYNLDGLSVFEHRQTPMDNFNNFLIKKTFDFFFSLAVLILLSPLFLIIALLIYIESSGSIFYTPMRKGEGGGTFKCYKFRTMKTCDSPTNGTKSTIKNDPRITRVGKYLRKFDLDELPQFFNVLKGDMSVVGPRPHRVNLSKDFRKIVNDYMVRHYVKPGITGWAQVNGWRGPTETKTQKRERIKHDLWYIEHYSFGLDLRIIFLTVFGRKTRINAF